jgi:hypothetical protein
MSAWEVGRRSCCSTAMWETGRRRGGGSSTGSLMSARSSRGTLRGPVARAIRPLLHRAGGEGRLLGGKRRAGARGRGRRRAPRARAEAATRRGMRPDSKDAARSSRAGHPVGKWSRPATNEPRTEAQSRRQSCRRSSRRVLRKRRPSRTRRPSRHGSLRRSQSPRRRPRRAPSEHGAGAATDLRQSQDDQAGRAGKAAAGRELLLDRPSAGPGRAWKESGRWSPSPSWPDRSWP